MIKKGRLRWFGCVKRKGNADRVKCCMKMELHGTKHLMIYPYAGYEKFGVSQEKWGQLAN